MLMMYMIRSYVTQVIYLIDMKQHTFHINVHQRVDGISLLIDKLISYLQVSSLEEILPPPPPPPAGVDTQRFASYASLYGPDRPDLVA